MQQSTHRAARKALLLIIAAFLVNSTTYAQRTMRYQNLITAETVVPYDMRPSLGGGVQYGQYTLGGYWKTGIYSVGRAPIQDKKNSLEIQTVRVCGEYMHRLFANRSRSISLYGGGGLFVGYEFYDPFKKRPEHLQTFTADNAFIYGLSVCAEAELFIARSIAITFSVNAPLTFGSQTRWIRGNSKVGIRFNI